MLDDAPATAAGITICRSIIPADIMPADAPNDRLRFWDGWDLAGDDGAINVLIGPVHADKEGAIDILLHGGDQLEGVDSWGVLLDRFLSRLPEGADSAIAKMIKGATEPYVAHPLYDRATADIRSGKSITLLGDAGAQHVQPWAKGLASPLAISKRRPASFWAPFFVLRF